MTSQRALGQPINTAVIPDIILDEDNGWPNAPPTDPPRRVVYALWGGAVDYITAVPNTFFEPTYNSTLYWNLLWDANKNLRIAFEVTYRQTDHKDPASYPTMDSVSIPRFSGPSSLGFERACDG